MYKPDIILICLVTLNFISMTQDSVTLFSRIKNLRTCVNASITVKVLDRISFNVMAENCKNLKDTLEYSFFFC